MTFKHVGEGLAGMISRWIDDPELRDQLVQHAWRRAAGSAIAEHTRVVSLRDGVMVVRVDESRWMPTLRELHVDLVDKIRDELGRDAVKRLQWEEPDPADDPGTGRRR
jgi:predicted nucleic acid-binding Zn ribbon protein